MIIFRTAVVLVIALAILATTDAKRVIKLKKPVKAEEKLKTVVNKAPAARR